MHVAEPGSAAATVTRGLTPKEAAEDLLLFVPNVVGADRRMPAVLTWVARIATDPMAILLVVASVTYAILGDRTDAIVSGVALLPIVLVGVVLEGRADAALARLRELTAPRARVVRDGLERDGPASDVVPGDVLALTEGDIIAADGELLDGRLAIDESTLTGEAIPVERAAGEGAALSVRTTGGGGRARRRAPC